MTVLVITGTDTGVGKTVATAALASHARQAGFGVAVCKPAQTGTAEGSGDGSGDGSVDSSVDGSGDDDLAEVGRLMGFAGAAGGTGGAGGAGQTELAGLARYPLAMAPAAAAEQAGLELPGRDEVVRLIRELDRPGRLTLVEGAGGLLVELAAGGVTLRDIAVDLGAAAIVITRAGLGTLNHTALTLEALAARGVACAGLVIGSWPQCPGPVETTNRVALERMAPVRAALPAGAGSMTGFAAMSAAAFDRDWVRTLVH